MKNILQKLFLVIIITLPYFLKAQDAASLLAEGKELEMKFKEEEAFTKYKQANLLSPSAETFNKLAELSLNIGGRKTDPVEKIQSYKEAQNYSLQARSLDSTKSDILFITAWVYDKLLEVEEKKE